MAGLEDESRGFRKSRKRRSRSVEQGAAAEIIAIAQIERRLAGRRAHDAEQPAALLELLEERGRHDLAGAIEEDNVVRRRGRPPGSQRARHNRSRIAEI